MLGVVREAQPGCSEEIASLQWLQERLEEGAPGQRAGGAEKFPWHNDSISMERRVYEFVTPSVK